MDLITHHKITHLCALTAQLLLANGAESELIVSSATRLGLALGVDRVECTLTANSIVLSVLVGHHYVTTAHRVPEHGVNMTTVAAIQRMVLNAEAGHIDYRQVEKILGRLPYPAYPRWLVAVMVALSCACFARLASADWLSCVVAFFAAWVGMIVRQQLTRYRLNVLIVFILTAFSASCVAGLALKLGVDGSPHQMMAASVLMLVPGFPLINALSDALKGYMNMGVGRWMLATVLTLGACLGIVLALLVLGLDSGVVLPR
ncbi:threonine/serine exporter family protein [Cardiobacteriaceae bacterium TAE3-ERU3]|nr:threonine/serine exporter family protein [Cardiobacteriaceae bacterium TAE3-ERU3]